MGRVVGVGVEVRAGGGVGVGVGAGAGAGVGIGGPAGTDGTTIGAGVSVDNAGGCNPAGVDWAGRERRDGEPPCEVFGGARTLDLPLDAENPSIGIWPPSIGGAIPDGGARTGAARTAECDCLVSDGAGRGGGTGGGAIAPDTETAGGGCTGTVFAVISGVGIGCVCTVGVGVVA